MSTAHIAPLTQLQARKKGKPHESGLKYSGNNTRGVRGRCNGHNRKGVPLKLSLEHKVTVTGWDITAADRPAQKYGLTQQDPSDAYTVQGPKMGSWE